MKGSDYGGLSRSGNPFGDPLPDPPSDALLLEFGAGDLRGVRIAVTNRVSALLNPSRTADVVLAVTEAATNSIRYGGGSGTLRVWNDGGAVVCEISDRGHLENPLVGLEKPTAERAAGRGIWILHQLCDLVQVRSAPNGTVVRLHFWVP